MTDARLSDEQIANALKQAIQERGLKSYSTEGEFASSLGLGASLTRVKQVLGRLITDGEVTRHRPRQEHPGDSYRPITYRLSGKSVT